jgi:hypothetical protein
MWRENSNLDQVQRIFRCGSEKILCSAENVREQMARPLSPVTTSANPRYSRTSPRNPLAIFPAVLTASLRLGGPGATFEPLGAFVHMEEEARHIA